MAAMSSTVTRLRSVTRVGLPAHPIMESGDDPTGTTARRARPPRPGAHLALGASWLFPYGIVPTFQPAQFGRVYAAYGGVFVLLSLLWGWRIDGTAPDLWDLVGAVLCLSGVAVIMYALSSL